MDTQSPANTPNLRPRRLAWDCWYVRIPFKWVIFAVVCWFVCFPNPIQSFRHIEHLRNMQALIEPDAPELGAWIERITKELPKARPLAVSQADGDGSSAKPISALVIQQVVQEFVLENVKYEWDWNLWGASDYMPTVQEMFEKARESGGEVREDCDGRAVIAASLMAALGYKPTIATDLRHVWVTTPEGEWMGPGGAKTMVATTQGTQVHATTLLSNIPISLSYGIAVFPLTRELIILLTAFVLMLRRNSDWRWAAVGLVLLVQGLLFMRLGYLAPHSVSRQVSSWPTWVGIGHVVVGFGALWRAATQCRARKECQKVAR
jgi:hypothetical protein